MVFNGYMKKFSNTQLEVLRRLDGATAPVEFNGLYARTVESLRSRGLVKVRRSRKSAGTYYYPDSTRLVLHVSLTDEGWNLIYSGGIDY
jgi:hypothetical protein